MDQVATATEGASHVQLSPQSLARVRFRGRDRNAVLCDPKSVFLPARGDFETVDERATLTAEEREIVGTLFARQGLDERWYRPEPLRRRLRAALRVAREATFAGLLTRIRQDAELARRLLDVLLIGYTVPFRDGSTFELLRSRILPELLRNRRGIRVWSVGCSQGAELLSVAWLLADLGCLEESFLRGTDVRPSAIRDAKARAPFFLQMIPETYATGELSDLRASFHRGVERIVWQCADVFQTDEALSWDLVLCRNLAIYLSPHACRPLWKRLRDSLALTGVLVVGKAERPSPSSEWLRLAPCLYRQVTG